MVRESIQVFEWKIKNFSCWCEAVHGKCIESPQFLFSYFSKAELYPRGGSGQDDRMSLRFCGVRNDITGELTFIGFDGSLIFTQQVNITQMGERVPLLSRGPKFEAVLAQIRGNTAEHKDQITLRFGICIQSHLDFVQSMCTTLDVLKISMKIEPKWTELGGLFPFASRNDGTGILMTLSLQGERILLIMKAIDKQTNAVLVESCSYILSSDGALVKYDECRHVCIDEEQWIFSESLTMKEFEGNENVLLLRLKIINGLVIQSHNYFNYFKEVSIVPNNSSTWSPSNQPEDSSTVLKKDLISLYHDQDFSDLQLKCDNVLFPVHKAILSARSPVFKAMLSTDMKEAASGKVDIEDMDSNTLGLFLTYMYSGAVENLQGESALKLYYAADKYQVPPLKKDCADFLSSNVSISNVCDILTLAKRHNDDTLTTMLQNFMLTNYTDLLRSNEWKNFMESQPLLAVKTLTQLSVSFTTSP